MALVEMNFDSQYLGCNHTISMILPDKPRNASPESFYGSGLKYKVLWLLHGTHGDHSDWLRKTKIELYACEHDLVVVMPSGMNAYYANWPEFATGYYFSDYFFKELMPMIYHWFPVSDKREDNYIAGLSMGGFGAMTYACSHPEKFIAASSLSAPAINPRKIRESYQAMGLDMQRLEKRISNAGGLEAFVNSAENVWDKIKELHNRNILPKLYFCIGENDFFYPAYREFKAFAGNEKMDIRFEEMPGYAHEWRFWDLYIEKIIKDVFALPTGAKGK